MGSLPYANPDSPPPNGDHFRLRRDVSKRRGASDPNVAVSELCECGAYVSVEAEAHMTRQELHEDTSAGDCMEEAR